LSLLEIDCTEQFLPTSIRVANCQRFPGLCVEAVQGAAHDTLICRYPLHVVSEDTEVCFVMASGVRHANFKDHGIELSPELLEELPPEMLEQIAAWAGSDASEYEAMYLRLTEGGTRRFVIGLDDLFNHSDEANCRFALSLEARANSSDSVLAWGEIHTLRPIAPGEELTLDYATFFGPSWRAPAGWSS
jgi:hypothetical protein